MKLWKLITGLLLSCNSKPAEESHNTIETKVKDQFPVFMSSVWVWRPRETGVQVVFSVTNVIFLCSWASNTTLVVRL